MYVLFLFLGQSGPFVRHDTRPWADGGYWLVSVVASRASTLSFVSRLIGLAGHRRVYVCGEYYTDWRSTCLFTVIAREFGRPRFAAQLVAQLARSYRAFPRATRKETERRALLFGPRPLGGILFGGHCTGHVTTINGTKPAQWRILTGLFVSIPTGIKI